jgi:hypothetical protein
MVKSILMSPGRMVQKKNRRSRRKLSIDYRDDTDTRGKQRDVSMYMRDVDSTNFDEISRVVICKCLHINILT